MKSTTVGLFPQAIVITLGVAEIAWDKSNALTATLASPETAASEQSPNVY